MNPYVNHNRIAAYVTTEADVGQRWITMLGYCSSTYAGASDYLLNETMEIALSVINGGVASHVKRCTCTPHTVDTCLCACYGEPPHHPLHPRLSQGRPLQSNPSSSRCPAPPSPWQSIIDFIIGR
jgi:hypothetical protein